MIRSMTGFAQIRSRQKKGGFTVEIRSLNHRYFELSLRVPPSLYPLEDRIREACQNRIKRGKVTVNISEPDGSGLEEVTLDEEVLRFYLSAIRKMQQRFRLEGSIRVSDLLTLPRIFSVEKKGADPEKIWRSLRRLLEQTLDQLTQSKVREGKVLARDLLKRLAKIERGLLLIEHHAKALQGEYYGKLRERIRSLLEEKSGDERVWREAAFLAEKADTTEELVRLKSHLHLFREKLKKEREVGKELDFLVQEMNREVNTLSAKAQDFGISKEVVSIKAELEKIREQVQNIE